MFLHFLESKTTGNDVNFNDSHPNSKSHLRKPFSPRRDRDHHEANIIPTGPTSTLTGCKLLGMFLYVHFLLQVTII